MRLSVYRVDDQLEALDAIVDLARRSAIHPSIRKAAIALTSECEARDDLCELEAIFNAIKHGDPRVPVLDRGYRYVADPRETDHFTAPYRSLALCGEGACGGDCDDHTMIVMSLGAAIGFRMGARAWGKKKGVFTHVYPVAALPKREPFKRAVGLDTTVPYSYVGWDPPYGYVHTEWID